VSGLCSYDNDVVSITRNLKPSARGEYEIPRSTRPIWNKAVSGLGVLERGAAWLETGTFESLLDLGNFVRTVEHRQRLNIGVPEEIAWRKGFLSDEEFEARGTALLKSGYGQYLLRLLEPNCSAAPWSRAECAGRVDGARTLCSCIA
jgi:glucose-1-phosphate thymidylyltransferase